MFEITIEQALLSKVLSYVEPTVGKNNQFNTDCIEMSCDTNGVMTVMTNNSMEFAVIQVVVSAAQNGNGSAPLVPFKKFKSIIDTIDGNDMITLKNLGNVLGISYSSSLSQKPIELSAVSGNMLPIPTVQNSADTIELKSTEFKQIISMAADITDPNASMPIYSCMRIEQDNGHTDCSCIDYTTKRLFSYGCQNSITGQSQKSDVLIEVHKMQKAMKMFEYASEIDIDMDGTNVHVYMDNSNNYLPNNFQNISAIDYYCRRVMGSYPANITSSLTPGCDEYASLDISALKPIMMRVKAIDDQSPNSAVITLDIVKDTLSVRHSTTLGKVDEEVTINNMLNNTMHASFNYKDFFDIIESLGKVLCYTIDIGKLKTNGNYYMISPYCAPGTSRDIMFAMSSVTQQTP